MLNPRHLAAPLWLAAWRAGRALFPEPAGSFRILLFHDVPTAERPAFAQLVHSLAQAGRLITPAEAEARLDGAAPKGQNRPPCLISFDDGFTSNLEVAETILAPLGAKALFFICPGLAELSGKAQAEAIAANVFDGKRGPGDLSILGWDGVERLMALGHSIGSHTLSHKRLTVLSPAQRSEQIDGAAQAFQARLGTVPQWFAYTFGDVGSIDTPSLAAIAARHRYCRSGVRGLNHSGLSPLALRADHVDLAAPAPWRDVAVEGGLDPLYRSARAALDGMVRGL